MRIDSSIIGMESVGKRHSVSVTTRRLRRENYGARQSLGGDLSNRWEEGEKAEVKEEKKNPSPRESMEAMGIRNVEISRAQTDFAGSFRQYVIKYIFLLLFGEEKTRDLFKEAAVPSGLTPETEAKGNGTSATLTMTPLTGKYLSYEEETYYAEEQSFSFQSTGTVHTADGRTLNFQVDLSMSQSFSEYYRQEAELASFGKICDPLVINFDNSCAKLEDQRFRFDLDVDGEEEEIAMLSGGSGYLALDKNEDGMINNGSELFGPKSADGFGELAAYDEDGNGWIDENDSVWDSLKIWCKNKDGSEELYRLKDKGVGAICLSRVRTDLTLKNQEKVDAGYLRSTGIFLFEDGRAGTMQHLDLV